MPLFPYRTYDSYGISCASSPLLHPPRSRSSPSVPELWSFAWCDGLAGVSGLAAAAADYSLASPPLSRLPPHLYYPFVYSRALSPVHPPLRSRPRSCPRLRPCSHHRFLPSVPRARFSPRYHIISPAPGLTPEAAGYLLAPPPVCRDDAAYGMTAHDLLVCFFPDVADFRVLFLPPRPSPFPFPFPSPLLPSFPIPSPSPSYIPSLVSAPVLVPAPPPSPFPLSSLTPASSPWCVFFTLITRSGLNHT